MEVGSLSRIKDILVSFGNISGLECNVDKTILMQVGSDSNIDQAILDLGFDVKREITLLSLIIENDTGNFQKSLSKITNTIKKEINFWIRFNLSLPGRIAIAKAMLYSQLNFLGCFLPVSDEMVQNWSNLIENYVMGPLNIAKSSRYLSREEGGLGLFDIKIFLGSQKCNWIKRAKNLDDYWKQRLFSKSPGHIFNLRSKNFDKNVEPVLYSIVESYENFLTSHTKAKENCKKSFIFDNSSIFFFDPNVRTLDETFSGTRCRT